MAEVLFNQIGQQVSRSFCRLQKRREIFPPIRGVSKVTLQLDFAACHELRMQAIGTQEQQ